MVEKIFNQLSLLIQSVLTFFKILLRSKLFLPFHKASSKSCVILGNGPSLRKVLENYEEILKHQTLLCVNKFPDTPHFIKLKPRYFLFTSKEFYQPGTIREDQNVRDNIIRALIDRTTWPITLFCPVGAKSNSSFIQNINQNPNIEIVFFNTTPIEGLPFFNNFFMKMGWASPRPHNVLIPSILNTINSGFGKIYLVGADHSWLPMITVDENNVALVNRKHFYDLETAKGELLHKESRPRRLHEVLEKFMFSFRSYFMLKDFAESKGVKIYNCTPDSFIDAFERKPITHLKNEKQ